MATLELAIELAARFHAGQRDKGGAPYILHPLRVMASVSSEAEKIVAVLHDIVEDTEMDEYGLRQHGFSDEIVEAVLALTKREKESRIDAAKRAAANPIARVVKLADVADNMDLSRLEVVTTKDLDRIEQYKAVKRILEAS
ncbi:HD domain-containing protein [Neisseria shayeganii]|uniref:Bifunctional (P)ppGpp synthetase/guanosine-3',5'-bis(Diphosphate) 3'-pyrophosphohydrolase n=1 Tax=Neisseria shayeganii TaxID=607712 RepID=A0A7D7SIC3_9NEIS|nr:HD domain-containing protein [Neisseria shayeganii]QMT41249.1 bifunctional (p)ppGpp synthetase/guanosine-3',5'-bis(diphosphate) 3'-pyrophosphohydrolase [Neisseria shayeganii]